MTDRVDVDNQWHLKKELNVGHLLTTIVLGISIIAWGNSMSERLTAQEIRVETLDRALTLVVSDNRDARLELLNEIRQMRRDINNVYVELRRPQPCLNAEK